MPYLGDTFIVLRFGFVPGFRSVSNRAFLMAFFLVSSFGLA